MKRIQSNTSNSGSQQKRPKVPGEQNTNIGNLTQDLQKPIMAMLPRGAAANLAQANKQLSRVARTQHATRLQELKNEKTAFVNDIPNQRKAIGQAMMNRTLTGQKAATQLVGLQRKKDDLTARIGRGTEVVKNFCQRCHKPHAKCQCKK